MLVFKRRGLRSIALSIGLALTQIHAAYALTLSEAYQAALKNDPAFQSAIKDYEAGLENGPIGLAAVLPKIAANYSKATNRTTISYSQTPNGTPTSPYLSNANYPSDYGALQLTQPIFSMEAYARLRQGKAQTEFARSKFAYLTQDLSVRLMQAYTDLLYSIDVLRFQKAEYDAFSEQAKVTMRLYEKGEGLLTDALQAKASSLVSQSRLLENENDVINAKIKLESLIGSQIEDTNAVAKLAPNFRYFSNGSDDFASWKEKAIANNVELKAMKDQIEIANQEYKKNLAGHYPVVNLIAAATQQTSYTTSTINQFASQSYVGVQVNLPIYGGGEIQARANQSYALYEKAQSDYRATYDRVLADLRKQYDIVITARKKIDSLTGALDASKELVKAMRSSVNAGEKINLDVLTADKTLYISRRDLSQAKYAYLIAYLKLNQMAGSSEMDDFERIQTYFH